MLILACAALALPTSGEPDRPSLEEALAEAHVVVTGAVVAERELRLDAHRREPVLEIRVETWHYGRDPKDAVFLRAAGADGEPPRIGDRALFLLDERTAYRHEAADGEPRRLFREALDLRVPLEGDAALPASLHERLEVGIAATTPRIRVREVSTGPAPRRFELAADGGWKLVGGFPREAAREGRLDEADLAAALAAAAPERFFALPRRVGRMPSPDSSMVFFELRTRDGVHEVRLGRRVEGPKQRAAAAHLRRLFDALPIDPAVWSEP